MRIILEKWGPEDELCAKGLCRDWQVNGVRAAWSPRVRDVCLQSHPHRASLVTLKIPLIKCLDMMEVKTAVGFVVPALIVPRKIIPGHGPVSSGGASLWYHFHWRGGHLHRELGGPPNQADHDPPRSCPVCRYSKVAVFDHHAFLFGDGELGQSVAEKLPGHAVLGTLSSGNWPVQALRNSAGIWFIIKL